MVELKILKKVVICIIVVVILVPLGVNFGILLCDFIPSAGNNGEWLSFYGNLLGGIIGGIITIIGIYISIKSVTHNVKPLIVPLRTRLFAYVDGNSIHIVEKKIKERDDLIGDNIFHPKFIRAINVGLETAINIEVIWNLEDTKEMMALFKKMEFSESDWKSLNNSFSLKGKKTCYADYIISSKSSVNESNIEIPSQFMQMLTFIFYKERDNHNLKNYAANNALIEENILTNIEIKYYDIYGNPLSDFYTIKFKIDTNIIEKVEGYTEKYILLNIYNKRD